MLYTGFHHPCRGRGPYTDSMDDHIKPRGEPNALPRPYHPTKRRRTRPSLFISGEHILTLYPPNQEQLYPGYHHLCRESKPQTSWAIKSNQGQTLMLYLGLISSQEEQNQTFLIFLVEQILTLFPSNQSYSTQTFIIQDYDGYNSHNNYDGHYSYNPHGDNPTNSYFYTPHLHYKQTKPHQPPLWALSLGRQASKSRTEPGLHLYIWERPQRLLLLENFSSERTSTPAWAFQSEHHPVTSLQHL